ncbi:cardiolipin synthase [Halomonas cibimaris]|uniref:Cardiolipin synthase n=1 Tax=Halomonas cibimaris TaxID=657012 RepID=A0ABP7LVP5_9GAMM
MTSSLVGVMVALFYLLGLVSVVMALMSSRTSQGAVAWIISLLTFPYVAVPAYWLFGRPRFYGYVSARGARDSVLRQALSGYRAQIMPHLAKPGSTEIQAVEQLAMMPLTRGNQADLLIDGKATFSSLFAGLDSAQKYILVQFFIVRDDALGQRLKKHLFKAVERGVQVHFLYDEIGSHALSEAYLAELNAAGVSVSPFRSSRGLRHRFQINFRNHRKVTVVDGQKGWVGGLNVGVEYLGQSKRHGAWRDTHLALEGPSVLGLQEAFWEDWHWATGEVLELDWQPCVAKTADHPVVIVPSGPADQQDTASLLVQNLIYSAKERLWLTSPYFVPDQGVQDALRLAAMRGVDVRVMMPERPDHLLVYWSALAFLPDMLRGGVKIYRYLPGFLHQKVILIDSDAASIGTVNLDNRSFRLNFEITAFLPCTHFAADVDAMLRRDFHQCREVSLDELRGQPLWKKVISRAAYLTSPIQ